MNGNDSGLNKHWDGPNFSVCKKNAAASNLPSEQRPITNIPGHHVASR
jgi:hypothetical protein